MSSYQVLQVGKLHLCYGFNVFKSGFRSSVERNLELLWFCSMVPLKHSDAKPNSSVT